MSSSSGCLQIQQNKFPGDFQELFYIIPVDFFTVFWSVVNQEVMYQHELFFNGARDDELQPTLITAIQPTNQKWTANLFSDKWEYRTQLHCKAT